jgi:hypothetical protein
VERNVDTQKNAVNGLDHPRNPSWWTPQGDAAWDRVKDAVRREWAQAALPAQVVMEALRAQPSSASLAPLWKSEAASRRMAEAEEQLAGHFADVQRDAALENERQHGGSVNPELRDVHWLKVEPATRYGFLARHRPESPRQWDHHVEDELRTEWNDLRMEASWEDSLAHVRRGWDHAHQVDATRHGDVEDRKHRAQH